MGMDTPRPSCLGSVPRLMPGAICGHPAARPQWQQHGRQHHAAGRFALCSRHASMDKGPGRPHTSCAVLGGLQLSAAARRTGVRLAVHACIPRLHLACIAVLAGTEERHAAAVVATAPTQPAPCEVVMAMRLPTWVCHAPRCKRARTGLVRLAGGASIPAGVPSYFWDQSTL